jgi:hypothetical protein
VKAQGSTAPLAVRTILLLGLVSSGCGLFEPRDPEDPASSRLDFVPPTEPSIVISNLQNAVDQKNVANYTACFSDPSAGGRAFVFVPSAEASAQYGPALSSWGTPQEQTYFQNLIARSPINAAASLQLTQKSQLVTADSVIYSYDYIFTFEHSETGFPKIARGNLQFALAPDAANRWSIYRWIDFKTGSDITWSMFKGKFSN